MTTIRAPTSFKRIIAQHSFIRSSFVDRNPTCAYGTTPSRWPCLLGRCRWPRQSGDGTRPPWRVFTRFARMPPACWGEEWPAGAWGRQPPMRSFPLTMPRSLLRGGLLPGNGHHAHLDFAAVREIERCGVLVAARAGGDRNCHSHDSTARRTTMPPGRSSQVRERPRGRFDSHLGR